VSVTWSGLDELRENLRTLTPDLAEEADGIIEHEAQLAKAEVAQGYPPGELRDRLGSTTTSVGRFGTSVMLSNSSPVAWIFENGSQARHNKLGANRGVMPPAHAFVPPIVRHRAAMWTKLRALVERAGLVVTGTPDV
jgi:hypothetical protein